MQKLFNDLPDMKHEQIHRPHEVSQAESLHHQGLPGKVMLEFAHADQLLRYDSMRTDVPSSLEGRIQNSIRARPNRKRSWWRRLLRW